jgi:UDP-glucose 4-epimerase
LKRIIITGGNGFIGSHLVKKLLSETSWSIILISDTQNANDKKLIEQKSKEDLPIIFYNADIRDFKAVSEIFRNEKADTCIHLAAKISVAESIKNPQETMEINVDGTQNILDACHKSQVENFLFASSAAVYGDVKELPIKETSQLDSQSPYGKSKMIAERIVQSYQASKKIQNAIILRIFNVYGKGQHSETDVVTKFASKLSRKQAPIIYGNGQQTRDFVSLDDVVMAMVFSLETMQNWHNIKESVPSTIINIGTGKPTSINEIAQKMISISGLDLVPTHVEETAENKGIVHSYADVIKAKEIINFVASKQLDEGLKEILEPAAH